jgi:hypothetical protein
MNDLFLQHLQHFTNSQNHGMPFSSVPFLSILITSQGMGSTCSVATGTGFGFAFTFNVDFVLALAGCCWLQVFSMSAVLLHCHS